MGCGWVGGLAGGFTRIMPRYGSILQAGTRQILSLAENPRWSPSVAKSHLHFLMEDTSWYFLTICAFFKTPSWHPPRHLPTPSRHIPYTFQTPSEHLPNTFRRHLPDIVKIPFNFIRSSRHIPNILQVPTPIIESTGLCRSQISKLYTGWVAGGSHVHNHATSWLHLASWNLPDSQLSWESKMEPSVAIGN